MSDAEALRDRIYASYLTGRHAEAGGTLERGFESRAPYLRALVRKHFPAQRDAAILDLGCGSGALMYFARQAGYSRVEGVDRSPEQVVEAHRLGLTEVRQGDLQETLDATPSASIDVAVSFDVLEHLTRGELLALVDSVHRVLVGGGRWIIHAPNAESPFFGRIRYGDLTHERAFTRTSMGQLLLASGFESVACYEDVPVIHGVVSGARWAIWKAARSALRLYLAAETGALREPVIFSQNFLTVAMKAAGRQDGP